MYVISLSFPCHVRADSLTDIKLRVSTDLRLTFANTDATVICVCD